MATRTLPSVARWLAAAAALAALIGCASVAPRDHPGDAPSVRPPEPFPPGRAPLALVLSGGGLRGYAHVGVIRVLEEAGIRPDLVVGSSAGSIVGALYASGLAPDELEHEVGSIGTRMFSDVLPGFGFLRGESGLVRGERLHRFVDERARHHLIENFPIRFAAVATELADGEAVAFNAGDAGLAVLASSAVPGLVAPVVVDGRRYADGAIASPLPVLAARKLGGQVVIAVDVGYPPRDSRLTNPVSVMFQAYIIAARRLTLQEATHADVVIAPAFPRTTQFTLSEKAMLMAVGEKAAREALPGIRAALGRARAGNTLPEERGGAQSVAY